MPVDLLFHFLGISFSSKDADNVLIKLLVFLLILLLTWLLRRIVTMVVPRLVKFLAHATRTTLDEQLVTVLQPPVHFLIGVLGVWLAFVTLELPDRIDHLIGNLMASLVAVAICWAAYRGVDLAIVVLRRVTQFGAITEATLLTEKVFLFIQQVTKGVVILFMIVLILDEWGYNVSGLLAGLGLGGLAVALAAQDALTNLIGYFVIIADEPFVVGEYVVVDGVSGTVEQLGFRSTRIRVLDQSLVTVPNKTMTTSNIVNWSRLTKRRLNMTLSLSYGSSPAQMLSVVQAIRDMLRAHPQVERESVLVQFVEVGTSSLDITIICFTKTPAWNDFQVVRQDINLKIMEIMEERGVENANPTYNIVMEPGLSPVEQAIVQETLPPLKPEPSLSTTEDSPVPDDAAN
jgi:MscS family membrane protein